MGGGMGLMQGVGICIVILFSCLVMLEIGIGLYLDVGVSWFFVCLFGRFGLFFGLSVVQMNVCDVFDFDLVDCFFFDDQQDVLFVGLVQMNWNELFQV